MGIDRLTIAIVDESGKDREKLKSYLDRYEEEKSKGIEVTFFSDGVTFLDSFSSDHGFRKFDFIFLDIDLPFRNGFLIAEELRKRDKDVPICFYATSSVQAIKGYDYSAVGFLLKSINYSEFVQKFEHMLSYLHYALNAENDSIFIFKQNRVVSLPVSEIIYVEVSNHTLTYHHIRENVTVYDKLSTAEEKLKEKGFALCNACYLVNLRFVTQIKDGYVFLGKEQIRLSRPKKKAFTEKFKAYTSNH